MKPLNLNRANFVAAISVAAATWFCQGLYGAPPATSSNAPAAEAPGPIEKFSARAEALPFPPDARELEFDATFDDIEYASGSSLASLAAFYRREMPRRGWTEDEAAGSSDEESVEMTFKHDGAQVVVELDGDSDEVNVSLDCEGLDFAHASDPAALIEAGVPQPRSYVFLQREVPRPPDMQDESYESDECHFKSKLVLQKAFDFYGKELKAKGWRESRKPIVTDDRRYTEFKRGPITLSVNIFSDEVGSRIILEYENPAKEAAVAPLPPVAGFARRGEPGIAGENGRRCLEEQRFGDGDARPGKVRLQARPRLSHQGRWRPNNEAYLLGSKAAVTTHPASAFEGWRLQSQRLVRVRFSRPPDHYLE